MARSRILLGACVLCVALPGLAVAQQPDVDPVPVGTVADKLGAKVGPSSPRELELGRSATTTLAEPQKLASYGIKGMHEGARVTITCVGPNRVRVEVDEMEPVSQRAAVTLKVSTDGSLTPVAERPAPPKAPPI
ncbi:MAG TPA: hypothetical protein VKP00_02355 [Gemmatimonadaceae bacterium]|nr:hypothetical protein [Gemmatimonadaceae bacterium]